MNTIFGSILYFIVIFHCSHRIQRGYVLVNFFFKFVPWESLSSENSKVFSDFQSFFLQLQNQLFLIESFLLPIIFPTQKTYLLLRKCKILKVRLPPYSSVIDDKFWVDCFSLRELELKRNLFMISLILKLWAG